MAEDLSLRLLFDNVPEVYDRVRPTYPDALFNELLSRFEPPAHVLEIGPGTGQATGSLLAHGARVKGIEPGPRMAAFLRHKFADNGRLEVLNALFEDAPVSPKYDIVLAATSFHWIDPEVRFKKAHDALRSGGALAVVNANQINSDADRGFFKACQPIYQRYYPDEEEPHGHDEDVIPEEFEEVVASESFGEPELFRYRWDQTYTSAQYADLLRSYSGTQSLSDAKREGLIAELCALADAEFGGSVTRPLVVTMTLAYRA